ncbi:protein kinase domain-containing protein [Candidatus Nitrospira salsa]
MDSQIFSGKYQVQREIAKGGMGVIYHALDLTLRRQVAIKVLHPQFSSDPAFAQRFLREARAMARLDHPNIMRIYAVEEEQNRHYIVMEYCPGKDLKDLIREQSPLSLTHALRIAIQTAEALTYAHNKGIVHRDIKPGNIMLTERDQVKITDFGIAAALDESSVTVTGTVIGTPEYMSPEQARGELVDARSDLYSLGMVTYEMITGKTPYKGIPGHTIIGKLAYESSDPILTFPQHTPLEIQDVIRGLIKKNPDERISSPDQIIGTLTYNLSQLEQDQSNVDATMALAQTGLEPPQPTVKRPRPSIGHTEAKGKTAEISESRPPSDSMNDGPKPTQDSNQTPPESTRWSLILVGGLLTALCILGVFYSYPWPFFVSEKKEEIGHKAELSQQTHTEPQRQAAKNEHLTNLATAKDVDNDGVQNFRKAKAGTEAKQQAELAAVRHQEEAQRLAAEQAAQTEKKAREKAARERQEAEARAAAERQRLAAEQDRQRQEAEQLAKTKAEKDRLVAALEAESKRTEQEKAERQRLIEELKRREQEDQQRRDAGAKAAAEVKQRAELAAARHQEEAQRLVAEQAAQTKKKARENAARERQEVEARAAAERQRLAAEQDRQRQETEQLAKTKAEKDRLVAALEAESKKTEQEKAERQRLIEELKRREQEDQQRRDAEAKAAAEAKQRAKLAESKRQEAQRLAAEQAAQTEKKARENAARERQEAEARAAAERQRRAAEQDRQRQELERQQITVLLENFQKAYETQSLPTLQQITTMDSKRVRYLQLMFKTYSTIQVATEIESITNQGVSAKLLITKLIDQKGKRITPNPIIRETTLTIPKEGEQWGKIQW